MNKITVDTITKFIILIFYLLLPINNTCAFKQLGKVGKEIKEAGKRVNPPPLTGHGRTQPGQQPTIIQLPSTTGGSFPLQGKIKPGFYPSSITSLKSVPQQPYSGPVVQITQYNPITTLIEELQTSSSEPIQIDLLHDAAEQAQGMGYQLAFITQKAFNYIKNIAKKPMLKIINSVPIPGGFLAEVTKISDSLDLIVCAELGSNSTELQKSFRSPKPLQAQITLKKAQQRAQEQAKQERAALVAQKAADALKAKEIEEKNQREIKNAQDAAEMETLFEEIEETEIRETIKESEKKDLESAEKQSQEITAERQKLELELAEEEQELTALEQEQHTKKSEYKQQLEKIEQETARELAKEEQDKEAFLAEQKIKTATRKKELKEIEIASLQARSDALKAEQDLIEAQTKLDNATIKTQQEEINVQIKQKQLEKEEQDIKKLETEHAEIQNTIKDIQQLKKATELNLTAQLEQIEADTETALAQAKQNYIKDLEASKAKLKQAQSFINLDYNKQQNKITKLENESKAKATATELSIKKQKEDAAKQNQETAIKEQQEYDTQQAQLLKSKDTITNNIKTQNAKAQQFALEIQQIKDLQAADQLKLLDLQNNIKTIQQQKETTQLSLTEIQEQIAQTKKELEAIQPPKTAEVIQQEKNQIILKTQEAEQSALAALDLNQQIETQKIQEKLTAAKKELEQAKEKNELSVKQEAELIKQEEEKTLQEITNLKNSIEARKQATLKNIKKKETDELAKIENEIAEFKAQQQAKDLQKAEQAKKDAVKKIKPEQKPEIVEKEQKPKEPSTQGTGDIPEPNPEPSEPYKPEPKKPEPITPTPKKPFKPIEIAPIDITPMLPVDIEPPTVSTLPSIAATPQTRTTPISATPYRQQPSATPTLKIPLVNYHTRSVAASQPHYGPIGRGLTSSYTENKLTPTTGRRTVPTVPSLSSPSSYFPMVESNNEPILSGEQHAGALPSAYETFNYEEPEKEKPIIPAKPAKLINEQQIVEEVKKPKEELVALNVPQIDLPSKKEAEKPTKAEEIHWFWRIIMTIEAYIRQIFS